MSERPPATPHPSPLAWPLARLSWRLKTLAANTPCPESPGPSNRRCWACSRACPQPLLALRSGVGEPRASPVHVTAAPLLRERAKTERSYGTSSKLSAGNVRSWGSTQAGGTPPPCPLLDQSLGFRVGSRAGMGRGVVKSGCVSGLPALALQRVGPVKGFPHPDPAVYPETKPWAVRAYLGQQRSARARCLQPVGVWPSPAAHGELAPGRNLPAVGPEQCTTPGGAEGWSWCAKYQPAPKPANRCAPAGLHSYFLSTEDLPRRRQLYRCVPTPLPTPPPTPPARPSSAPTVRHHYHPRHTFQMGRRRRLVPAASSGPPKGTP